MSRVTHITGIAVLLILFGFECLLGHIESVRVEPIDPTSLDSITVSVSGYVPDGCWGVSGPAFSLIGYTINVEFVALDSWMSGLFCPMVIEPYAFQKTFGPLPAGDYVVNVTEHHDSERDPLPEYMSEEFSVRGIDLSLKIEPSETLVVSGDIFTIDVVTEDIFNLGAFQLDITFDSHILHGLGAQLGSFLGSTGRIALPTGPTICNTVNPGILAFGGMSFGFSQGPDGSGTLATIAFQAIKPGTSELRLANAILTDVDGNIQAPNTILSGRIEVAMPSPVDLIVSPDSVSLLLAESFRFTAQAYDMGGGELEVTPLWNISPPELGEIDTNGCFVPRELGTGWIVAVIDTLRDSSFVHIRPFDITCNRGEDLEDALQTPFPYSFHIDPPMEYVEYDSIPITTYTYDPEHELWTDSLTQGTHYPGSKMYITCVFGASVDLDSITILIPPRGASSFMKTVTYYPGGTPQEGDFWETLIDSSKLYIGYDWTIYDGSLYEEGLQIIEALVSVNEGEMYSDTDIILLDTEDPDFHISFKSLTDSTDLPTILHPTWGKISITQSQQVLTVIIIDQTTPIEGHGPFWPLVSIVSPCFPDIDIDHIVNECGSINADSIVCRFSAEGDSCLYEAIAAGRDAAGNLLRYDEGSDSPILLLVDDSPPSAPVASHIRVYDTGQVIGRTGAVGQDWYGSSLKVLIYTDSLLTEPLTEVEADSDGRFEALLDVPLSCGDVLYFTARDRAGNEGEATGVSVRIEGAVVIKALKTDILLLDNDRNGKAGPGDTFLYRISIRNEGDMAATGVTFTDELDHQTELTVGTVSISSGDIISGNSSGDTMVSVMLGTISPDDTISISFQAAVKESIDPCVYKIANRGEISADDLPLIFTDDPETEAPNDYTITPVEFAVTFPLKVDPGWNLISFPVIPDSVSIPQLLPQSFSSWRYVDGYQPANELWSCTGYFILFVEDQTVFLKGEPVCKCCIDIIPGWNLIGSLICPVSIASLYDIATGEFPLCISPLDIWAFEDQRYVPTLTLEPGQAAWVFAFGACTVCYSCVTVWECSKPILKPTDTDGLEWVSTIQVANSSQNIFLEFGLGQKATAGLDMGYDRPAPPPTPDTEGLKASFRREDPYNVSLRRDITNDGSNGWLLIVETESEVTLSWDISSVPRTCGIRLDMMDHRIEMKKQAGITVDKGRHEMTIRTEVVPLCFGLGQNAPNPFNPITNIRCQIAGDRQPVHTTLKIYNILGQEVRTLVDEAREPGYYTVTWDGKDGAGNEAVSGVYFYRLQAGDFIRTKRMLLLK